MARLSNGILGPLIGKIGTVVGSSRNGRPYLKGAYKKRTKKVSAAELANRQKFAMAQAWLRPVLSFVREGFKNYSETARGFIAAKSYLLHHGFEGLAPNLWINPAKALLSYGTLPLAEEMKVESIAPDLLRFSWMAKCVAEASPLDQVMLMAYDMVNGRTFYSLTGQFRKVGEDFLRIDHQQGASYHCYAAFIAADRKTVSYSTYLGEVKS
jgi:Family of unknown function (DUF6266)